MKDEIEITFNPSPLEEKAKSSVTQDLNPTDLDKIKVVGKITKEIGTGEDAKHSIIWTTIRWCFIIASAITLILFIFLGVAYSNNNTSEVGELKKFITTIWSVFTPIITLSLGYAFGKDYK